VKPPPLAYCRPDSIAQASERLRADEGAMPLSGGQSLVPLLNLRLVRPTTLVDLSRIPGLDTIETESESVRASGGVTHSNLERHAWPAGFDAITEGVSHIGYPAIRHRGTVGGSVAHADPAAELPTLATAFGAAIELTTAAGSRTVGADDFFVGYYTTARQSHELVTSVTWPTRDNLRSGFAEMSRRTGDFAIALAAAVTWTEHGERRARVVVGGLDVRPRRIPEIEAAVAAGDWREAVSPEALERHTHPTADIHASSDYRLHVGAEMVRRAVTRMEEPT
jgi:carbon-monoxide dehydrogenase medium subunit